MVYQTIASNVESMSVSYPYISPAQAMYIPAPDMLTPIEGRVI